MKYKESCSRTVLTCTQAKYLHKVTNVFRTGINIIATPFVNGLCGQLVNVSLRIH